MDHPFILAGAPLWALSAFLIFVPPAHSGTLVTAGYFFVVLQVFFLTATISGAPCEALLPEIAGTTAERVSVSGYRVAIGIAGAGVGLIGSGLMVSLSGFTGMAATISVLALASRGCCRRSEACSTRISPSEGLSFRGRSGDADEPALHHSDAELDALPDRAGDADRRPAVLRDGNPGKKMRGSGRRS
ncbi:MAG: MFS transporter [Thermomicrobiales bacterium]